MAGKMAPVDIYIKERNGDRSIRIPWLPEKIHFESGGTIRATYDIMNRGPVEVPTGSGLGSYTWESEFPGYQRANDGSMFRGAWKAPIVYHNILEDWRIKGTPLNLMVIGYPINKDVTLDDYNGDATGAFGDIAYKVSFKEDRDITIQATITEINSTSEKRPTTATNTYTVVSGDNLWKIAQSKLGNGSRNTEIYNLNKEIIETTAKKHGYKSSNNGWWIFPSTVLQLPAK